MKFSRNGTFLLAWGSKGAGEGQFDTPHAIVIDARDRVYVADRENHRIQVFDLDGHFIAQWTGFLNPQGLALGVDESLYVGDGTRLVKLDLSGRLMGVFGVSGRALGQFMGLHGVSVGRNGQVFTAELLNWRVQKLVPQRRESGR